MEGRGNSLSRRIVLIIAFVLLVLNIILYVIIIGLNKSTLYDMEREKAQLIAKTYAPMLSIQLYLGMNDKVEKLAKQILVNKNVLQVRVLSSNQIIYSSPSINKIEAIAVVENIYEPATKNVIGTIEMIYSVDNYKELLSRNLKIMALFLIVFVLVFIGFSWYIQKQLNPLYKLSLLLGTYRSDSDMVFPYGQKSDEIGLISRALTNMNKRLQIERQKVQQNEQLLIQQSRQAAMGEMIGNIAHQWRQPLNTLGLVLQNLHFEYQMETLNDDFMDHSIDKGNKLIKNMSKTIDDFRNFFKPNKIQENFKVVDIINNTIELIDASFKNVDIKIKTNLDDSIELIGYPSEFSQVILNILSNAKDILVEKKESDRVVQISIYKKDKCCTLEIEDNGGGIPDDIINKVFEPYFTTKDEGKGTGIGLYMTKTIIESNMKGTIRVENSEFGARFIIEI